MDGIVLTIMAVCVLSFVTMLYCRLKEQFGRVIEKRDPTSTAGSTSFEEPCPAMMGLAEQLEVDLYNDTLKDRFAEPKLPTKAVLKRTRKKLKTLKTKKKTKKPTKSK